MAFILNNVRVLGQADRSVLAFDEAGITEAPAADARALDGHGLLLAPGLIDLHGDAFERQLMPRPGVHFPIDLALLETDRQMLANGITTAYHGLTWSWEPGLRGSEAAHAFVDAMARIKADLACDTRLHLRHELANLDAVDTIVDWLAGGHIDLLAFNDHIHEILARRDNPEKMSVYAGRTGLKHDAFMDLLDSVHARRPEVPASLERLAAAANRAGVPVASHDDNSPDMRRRMRALGSAICEFPLDEATAREAVDAGEQSILGAPNILRGGSHCGRLSAQPAAGAGLCTVLTSDYYYPSMLHAVFRLADDGTLPLARAWDLVSANAADAVGLGDRGRIATGRRADLVLVDDSDPALPRVVATFVAGRLVHGSRHLAA